MAPANNCKDQNIECREDIRDIQVGESYFTLASQSNGGRCLMNGMFIATWRSRQAAIRAAKGNADYCVVKCLRS